MYVSKFSERALKICAFHFVCKFYIKRKNEPNDMGAELCRENGTDVGNLNALQKEDELTGGGVDKWTSI